MTLALQKIIEEQINEEGASVEFLSIPPPKTEDERLGYDVRGLVSSWERRKIKARTLKGKIRKAKEGHIVGGKAPYGYRYVPRITETPGYYEIVEEEARWIREIFRLYAWEGLSAEAIARHLTEKKFQQNLETLSGEKVLFTAS